MKCREFESLIREIALDRMEDPSVRTRALSHAELCASCAARLNEARILAPGFAALAAATEEAAPELEAALLAAYRRHQGRFLRPATRPCSRARWLHSRWSLAAAAVIITIMVLTSYKVRAPRQISVGSAEVSGRVQPKTDPSFSESAGLSSLRNGPKPEIIAAAPIPAAVPKAVRVPRQGSRGPARTAAGSETAEMATDFMPVTYIGNLREFQSLQLVRTRVPRATLVSYGLPMNQEYANAPITADMLISPDGVVRAIRFVR